MEPLLLVALVALVVLLLRKRGGAPAGRGRAVPDPELVLAPGPPSLGLVPDQVDWQAMERAFGQAAQADSANEAEQTAYLLGSQIGLVTTQVEQLVEAANDQERRLRALEGRLG